MAFENITYYYNGKKYEVKAKICKSILSKFLGLMFRRNSPPLFFVFKKEKNISIHSFFCRPFKAIWLDENMKATKFMEIRKWRPSFSGRAKYLLEIPL